MDNHDKVKAALDLYGDSLLELPGVTGVGVSCKEVGDERTDELCVVVFVEEKLPLDLIPTEHQIPPEFENYDVKTDVRQAGLPDLLIDFPKPTEDELPDTFDITMYRPLRGGCMIDAGSFRIGTLGVLFFDTKARAIRGLTNAHVVEPRGFNNIYQPHCNPLDDSYKIGSVIAEKDNDTVDAAIISFYHSIELYNLLDEYYRIIDIGRWEGIATPKVNEPVRKTGCMSGLTEGVIDAIHLSFPKSKKPNQDLIKIQPKKPKYTEFATHGDSGSALVNQSNEVIGLLYGGSPKAGWALACKIQNVAKELGVEFEPDYVYTGTFETMQYWHQVPPHKIFKKYQTFPKPYPTIPKLAFGLHYFQLYNTYSVRIYTSGEDYSCEGFNAVIGSWGDSLIPSAGSSWLEIDQADQDIQCGTFNTLEDHQWREDKKHTSKRIVFEKPYTKPPTVVVWLKCFDLDSKVGWRIATKADEITNDGFTINIDTWNDSRIYSAEITWVAFPSDAADIQGGNYSTEDFRSWTEPEKKLNHKAIPFPRPFPPGSKVRVITGINSFDVECSSNLIINNIIDNISEEGFTWHLDTWGKTLMHMARAAYIAIVV